MSTTERFTTLSTQTIWRNRKGVKVAQLRPDGTVEFETNLYGGQSVDNMKDLHASISEILTDLAAGLKPAE